MVSSAKTSAGVVTRMGEARLKVRTARSPAARATVPISLGRVRCEFSRRFGHFPLSIEG